MSSLTHYSADRPLLLLTDYAPDFGGGGAVILRSLLDPPSREKLLWATLEPARDNAPADPRTVHIRGGAAPRRARNNLKDSTILARALADEVAAVARERGARALWILLQGAGVPIGARLIRTAGLPALVTVHDDPAFAMALRSRRYFALIPWIESSFRRALQGAGAVDVISRGMAERYRRRYGVDPIVIHRGIEPGQLVEGRFDRTEGVLRIGVLGNTYAYAPLVALGRAVADAAKALGVRGELLFVGMGKSARLKADLGDAVEIRSTGHVPEREAVEALRTCFAQYLNYPFGWQNAVLRQTSFPTKLGTYVMAGRPLLLHTPPDSSTAELAELGGYVANWPTMDPRDGAAALIRAWNDPASHASQHETAEAVRRRYYDLETNQARLFAALDGLVPPL